MRDTRLLLFSGLVLLILVGIAVAVALMRPETASNTNRRTATNFEDSFGGSPLEGSGPIRERGDRDPGAQPLKAVDVRAKAPVKPVAPKVEVTFSVSGVALDFFEDPAAGVTLTLLSESGSDVSGPTATTDDEGEFTFEAVLNEGEAYLVACLEAGKAITISASFTVKRDAPVEGLVIRIFDAARAYGTVVNGDTSEPLEGVAIELEGRQDDRVTRLGKLLGRVKPVRSGPDGSFMLDSIAPGKYIVRAVKIGWIAHEFNPITRAMQEMELAEYASFELLPFVLVPAGIVEGRVLRRSDRAPIVGATVELGTVLGGAFDTVTTDEEGRYRFDTVPPGMGGNEGPGAGMGGMAVRATAPGFALASRDLRVRSGQTRSGIDLLLDDGCVVTGQVIDHKGAAVAGAKVYYNDNDILRGGELVAGIAIPTRAVSTTTDESGRFTLAGLPGGNITITASAKGYANRNHQLMLAPGTPADAIITLEPAGAIEGIVLNERGEPVPGVPIAAYDASGPDQLGFIMKSFFGETLPDRGESTMFPASVRTDAEGRYRVDELRSGRYVLLANARQYEKYVSPELAVKAGETTTHDFSLATGGLIFGRVFDISGQPEAGAAVTCAALGGDSVRVRTAYTDRMGNYELPGLAPGTYTVLRNDGNMMRFMLPNSANQVALAAGESVKFDIYAQKPGTARLYGRVTLDGVPYGDESLVLLGGSFSGFAANTTRTDAQGNYEFRSVPLGTYQIAQSGGRMPSLVRQRVRVDKEGDTQVDIEFRTVTISGRVELEGGGIPTGNVRVLASPVSPEGTDAGNSDEGVNELEMMVFREVTTNPETGAFSIDGLSPGFYRLTVRSPNNGMVTRPYLNLRTSLGGVILTLPAVGATLRGTVTGLDEAENNTPFGLIAALTIEDAKGQPLALGGFDNGVNLTQSKEFTVANLAEGSFTVTLSMTGYTPVTFSNVKFTAGETVSLTFAFAASGAVRIRLLNQDIGIQTAFDLQYDIVNSKGEVFKKRFTFLDFFNADGTASQDAESNAFVIKDLPPETYTITLKLPGYNDAVRTFTVIAGQTAEISVEFQK